MDFIGSRNKGTGTLLGRLADLGRQTPGRKCPKPAMLPPEIQSACMRLGVPVSLFVGLMSQSVQDGFFRVSREEIASGAKEFPFQIHHLPPGAIR